MGHKRTIRPNAKKLSALFMARHQMDWDTFARKVKSCQRGFMGEPEDIRPGRGEFYETSYIRDHQSEKVALESVAKIKSTNDQKVRRVYRY